MPASDQLIPAEFGPGDWVTPTTIAEAVHVTPAAVRMAANAGKIRAMRKGARALFVDRESAMEYFVRTVTADDPIDAAAQRIADSWPELTEDQRARVATLLRPAVVGAE